MKSSIIKAYFNGAITHGDFLASIRGEVQVYADLMDKKGSTIPLIIVEDEVIKLTRKDLKKLLNGVLLDNTPTVNLSYICDCMTLCEEIEYEDEVLSDIVFEMADPEINGGYRKLNEIIELLKRLDN